MYRAPTTMSVKTSNATMELRTISHYDRCNNRYVPMLQPGEDLVWCVGDPVPTVVASVQIDRADDYEVCAMCEMPFFIKRCTRCGYEPA